MEEPSHDLPADRVEPDPRHFPPTRPGYAEACTRHREALARGAEAYTDPRTGFRVFTAATPWARGRCCELGCRHCPWRED